MRMTIIKQLLKNEWLNINMPCPVHFHVNQHGLSCLITSPIAFFLGPAGSLS